MTNTNCYYNAANAVSITTVYVCTVQYGASAVHGIQNTDQRMQLKEMDQCQNAREIALDIKITFAV